MAIDLRYIALRLDDEIVDESVTVLAQAGGQFADHAVAEILQHRHRFGQRKRAVRLVDLEPLIIALRGRIEVDRAILRPGEVGDAQHVFGRFLGGADVAVIGREGRGPAQREAGGAGRRDAIGQCRLYVAFPAAHHLFQPRVERRGIGHDPRLAKIDREADHRDGAVFERDRPVEDAAVRRLGQHLADGHAARGGEIVAREPDEGEEVPPERRAQQDELGPRAIGKAHRGERERFHRCGIDRGDEVVRQRGHRMGQRLAGVAGRVEAELGLHVGQPLAQHGDAARRGVQRGGGPQARMDRQAGDRAALPDRHHDEIDRHAAMDRRDQARLEEQRRSLAGGEIIDREVA